MENKLLKVHPNDNVVVALRDFKSGERVEWNGATLELLEDIPVKHKFSERDFKTGEEIIMYGVLVGKATKDIFRGSRISRENVTHSAGSFKVGERNTTWQVPDISRFSGRTFRGYHRADGKVGAMNYWLVIPLVFCENRNIQVIQDAMLEQLGYASGRQFAVETQKLIQLYRNGASPEAILEADIIQDADEIQRNRLFPNVDGIKFLQHDGGCGGIRQDSEALCRLLAGYITNSNVAGATILSLGCQHAQFQLLEDAIQAFAPNFSKPLYILEQQKSKSERDFIAETVKKTFAGLMLANQTERQPAPISKLILGLECGGSDGFSGISANPALGYASDLLVALGGTTILSEFPELNGVEQ
ncbi:MAG TPA: UxaA family hydrolase, partial [Saprospiraceae bacterium]|nr:UxaA family hydrolase [Saprospiraceae bacterium]